MSGGAELGFIYSLVKALPCGTCSRLLSPRHWWWGWCLVLSWRLAFTMLLQLALTRFRPVLGLSASVERLAFFGGLYLVCERSSACRITASL